MNSNLAEVLDAARALSRAERAEVAHELIASLETTNEYDEARYFELKSAVDKGIASLDAGRGIELSVDELGDYLGERGRLATERAEVKRA
ncbi:hypothetical protein G7067_09215 [Leucobacter insecticola]|uniref:Uncharacterized protein n=1 Tax=Leucobacter insecticola TaxID=2714934 RepID=A0A6G8FJJ5_9MICO|nr:hypothetical protein [Leucobacter insecticola]QIM16547.1 hypothetical protein G7067_09215 [Leucobacter insecticola]